jgi:hypothetical protein
LQVRFISVNDGYDSLMATLDETSLILPLKNLMNEIYARDISKKSQAGYKQKQKRGEYCGALAPYGYIKDGTLLIVDEETAPIVKQIFAWVVQGYSDTDIAKKLSDSKITPPSRYLFEKGLAKSKRHENTRFWYKTTIMRISTNLVYTGVLAQGKEQSNFLNGGGRIKTNPNEWIIRENTHTAIIEKEIFDKAQGIRSGRKKGVVNKENNPNIRKSNYENIFKGLIFCADCKAAMQRRYHYRADGSMFSKYVCNVYAQVDRNGCTKKNIKENDLREALYSYINKQINLAADISRIVQQIKKENVIQAECMFVLLLQLLRILTAIFLLRMKFLLLVMRNFKKKRLEKCRI